MRARISLSYRANSWLPISAARRLSFAREKQKAKTRADGDWNKRSRWNKRARKWEMSRMPSILQCADYEDCLIVLYFGRGKDNLGLVTCRP
jgi:hypothetical protein